MRHAHSWQHLVQMVEVPGMREVDFLRRWRRCGCGKIQQLVEAGWRAATTWWLG